MALRMRPGSHSEREITGCFFFEGSFWREESRSRELRFFAHLELLREVSFVFFVLRKTTLDFSKREGPKYARN